MPNWFFATDSQTSEDLQNELLTSTTRKLGNNLLHEYQASSRRQKGIKEELSRRIRLMQRIPDSHPREIFVFTDKGFKSFTPEVEDILTRDLLRKPQKAAVPKYLDYTRGMLKDEIEKGKNAQPGLKDVGKGQEEDDDQLKEKYEQLVEEFGAMETEHEQLMEKYKQLKKDHVQLQKEHERVLHELSGKNEMQTKAPEQKTTSAPDMRPRHEGPKQPPVLGGKILPLEIHEQAREALEAQGAHEGANTQAREKEAPKPGEAKIREWEEENFKKEMNKRERELREERAAREHQQMRASPKESPGARRLDIKTEGVVPHIPLNSIRGGVVGSKPTPQTGNLRESIQGQRTVYPNMQQYLPYQPKPASPRQANDVKTVSIGLPTKTSNMGQVPPADQKSDPLQQTDSPNSVSAGLPTEIPTMGRIFPAEQPLAQQPPLQRAPLPQVPHKLSPHQQFPHQQRSAPIRQARDTTSVPYGLLTGTPNIDPLFPVQRQSAPLQQTKESKDASFCLPTTTAPMPTDLRVPTLSSQSGSQLGHPPRNQELPRSQESPKDTNSDRGRAVGRVDEEPFMGLLDPS